MYAMIKLRQAYTPKLIAEVFDFNLCFEISPTKDYFRLDVRDERCGQNTQGGIGYGNAIPICAI